MTSLPLRNRLRIAVVFAGLLGVSSPTSRSEPPAIPGWSDNLVKARAESAATGRPILAIGLSTSALPSGTQGLAPQLEVQNLLLADAEVSARAAEFVRVLMWPGVLPQVVPPPGGLTASEFGVSATGPCLAVVTSDGIVLACRWRWTFASKAQAREDLLASLDVASTTAIRVELVPRTDAAMRERIRLGGLIDALGRRDSAQRRAACVTLGFSRNSDGDALASLAGLTEGTRSDERLAALGAMLRIDPKGESPFVVEAGRRAALAADDEEFGLVAAAVARFTRVPDEIIDALGRGARSADRTRVALTALTQLGPRACGAAGSLATLLALARDANARGPIVTALGAMGPCAAPAVPELLRLATEENTGRLAGSSSPWNALNRIGSGARSAVPRLTSLLSDRDASKSSVIELLAAIGSAARPARGALRALAASEPRYATAVADAIRRIELESPVVSK